MDAFDKLRIVRAETPDTPAVSLRMDLGQQALRRVELAINKCRVEDEFRLGVGDPRLRPGLDLVLPGLEVALDAIHACERVIPVESWCAWPRPA